MSKKHEVTAEVEVSKVLEKVWYPLIGGVVAFSVIFGGYLAYSYYAKSQEQTAQEQLFAIQKKVEEKNEQLAKEEEKKEEAKGAKKDEKKDQMAEALKKAADKAKIEEEKTPQLLQTRFADVIQDYENFISQNMGKKAAYMAAVQVAGLALEYKDLDVAEKVLTSATQNMSRTDLFAGLVRSQLGTVLLDKKKYAEAKEQFQKVIDSKELTSFHPQALLRLGVCYYSSGEFDQAESTWNLLEKDHPLTQAAEQAKGFKKLLTLKKGAKS